MFFGGVCQFIAGIMEFASGNTFGATVFPSYGAFNLSYAMIYIPGTGILASYTDSSTGQLNEQFPQALAMYVWAWFILTVIFTIAAMRSSWILFLDLLFLDIDLLLLACGYMLNNTTLLKAGNGIGFVVAFLSCKHFRTSIYRGCTDLVANRLGRLRRFMGWWHHANKPSHLCNVQGERVKNGVIFELDFSDGIRKTETVKTGWNYHFESSVALITRDCLKRRLHSSLLFPIASPIVVAEFGKPHELDRL
jgi:succinate-acetate transporter protein